jgi:hypothetical protein
MSFLFCAVKLCKHHEPMFYRERTARSSIRIIDENTWIILTILGVTSKDNTMKTNHTLTNKPDPKTTKWNIGENTWDTTTILGLRVIRDLMLKETESSSMYTLNDTT